MKRYFKWTSITIVILFVSAFTLLFFKKPPLLQGVDFSKAFYDDSEHLLRLTLSSDQKYRLYVPLASISPTLIDATLLQEDQYFRWHMGINPVSIIKAFFETYVTHTRRIGASTITMQVARLRFGINSKTWIGKIRQIIEAINLEIHYNKNQILEAYLNLAPYGNNIEGVGAASLIYFNKPAKELLLPESLTLAVIPQNPIQRTPKKNNLKEVRDKLFLRWTKLHPKDLNQKAMIQLPLQMQTSHHLPFSSPHFVNNLLQNYSFKQSEIETTLNIKLQTLFERITHNYLMNKKNLNVSNAAVLLIDTRDMAVKALIGSADFFNQAIEGEINGTDIKRSPGSTLKPFIYGLALDQGLIHPDTVLKDVPHRFGSYNPENFDYDFMGPIHAKDALVLSRNIPAIDLANQLNNPNLYEFLQRAHVRGLKSESYYGLALVLGGAEVTMQELTTLYAMLVNDGLWQPLRFFKNQPFVTSEKLLSPEASFLVLDMLKDTPRPDGMEDILQNLVSWKTGTSSAYRDAWSIGIIGPYVLAVWIGNFDNTSNHAFVGKNMAGPLFFELLDGMQTEMGKIPLLPSKLNQLHITQIPVCKASGLLPTRYCKDREMTWFIPGKSPIKTDNVFREVAIDKKTKLRTCHFDENTEFKIYEFWSSDLLKIFKEAGIQRKVPPPYDPECSLTNYTGISPQITSPYEQLSYVLRASLVNKMIIPFTAVADADVQTLYWFINNAYLGKSPRDQSFLWHATPGKYLVRVVDDHGRSDARDMIVTVEVN